MAKSTSFEIKIEVCCWECGLILNIKESDPGKNTVVSVEPCPKCTQTAIDDYVGELGL